MRRTSAAISFAVLGRPGVRNATVILLRDQSPMPSQQRLRCKDRRDLCQNFASKLLRFGSRAPSLIVIESHPSSANLFSQNAILLRQIFDNVVLMLVHPTCDGCNQN